ncbi:MAG: hypothetical protein IPM23_25905 [Candidatus Melainabacteria bacterium]|nr:hypothetical protein [Candidatus Melainabacteria bacterium]
MNVLAIYACFLLAVTTVGSLVLFRFRRSLLSYLVVAAVYSLSFIWVAFQLGRDIFDSLSMTCIGLFAGGSYFLIFSAMIAWNRFRKIAVFFLGLALMLDAVALDAFIIEPGSFVVTRYHVGTKKLARPLKFVVLADIQTDDVGPFEKSVLTRAMQEKPDAIFLVGDYIHAFPADRAEQIERLRKIMKETGLQAPLGVYATRGDSEDDAWTAIFKDLPVKVFPRSGTVANDVFTVTGLTLGDSFKLNYRPPRVDGLHIMIGHRPDFALSHPDCDLMIAGHTHGGQVQIPFFGPVLTFSLVPRQWAAGGLIHVPGDRTGDHIGVEGQEAGGRLIISRGIGMERGYAPRLRFLCRPELVVITMQPE